MNIIGDIGNTEVKICLIDNNYIIKKKINIKTNKLSNLNIKNKDHKAPSQIVTI